MLVVVMSGCDVGLGWGDTVTGLTATDDTVADEGAVGGAGPAGDLSPRFVRLQARAKSGLYLSQ